MLAKIILNFNSLSLNQLSRRRVEKKMSPLSVAYIVAADFASKWDQERFPLSPCEILRISSKKLLQF